jgi:hypothetical protein
MFLGNQTIDYSCNDSEFMSIFCVRTHYAYTQQMGKKINETMILYVCMRVCFGWLYYKKNNTNKW